MSLSLRVIDPNFPSYTITAEKNDHASGNEALYDRCFGYGRFAKTAERLREGNVLLKKLSLVAIDSEGLVIAAVRLWPLQIGETGQAVFVGPVAVDNQYRGSGLGLQMTNQCMELAKQDGWPLAILIGDAGYFSKIGFKRISTDQYPAPGYVPPQRLLALDLKDHALSKIEGPLSVPRAAKPEE